MPSGNQSQRQRTPLLETQETLIALLLLGGAGFALYLAHYRYRLTTLQIMELAFYLLIAFVAIYAAAYRLLTARSHRETEWPHPPLVVSPKKDERALSQAWGQSAVVLGYDVHGKPWLWSDRVRVMQGIVLGMTGSGKTTLLRNIITQDLSRVVGPPDNPHRIPMVIFDGTATSRKTTSATTAITSPRS